jgi:hypothetical protein
MSTTEVTASTVSAAIGATAAITAAPAAVVIAAPATISAAAIVSATVAAPAIVATMAVTPAVAAPTVVTAAVVTAAVIATSAVVAKPRSDADEDAIHEVVRSPIAVRRARVGRVVVIAVGAYWGLPVITIILVITAAYPNSN